jgi:hypothetical protein
MQDKPEPENGGPLRERDVRPLPGRDSQVLAGFSQSAYPILKGYIETDLKKGARSDVLLPGEESHPLLASWQYGKGKTIAFTTDLSGRWSAEWIQWRALERFWGAVLDWLSPPKQPLPPYETRIHLTRDGPVLDLFVYGTENGGNLFRFSVSGPKVREEGTLRQVAPGHYRTALPSSATGDYRLELVEERRGERIPYPPFGYTVAFDARSERPRGDFNLPLLQRLAEATGGEVNPPQLERQVAQERFETVTPLRPYLVFLALVLFLLEIFFRRFVLRTNP